MKILVTGGLGLVGKPLVARLLKHGHQVRVADLPAEGSLEGVDYRSCDITQYSAAREAVQDMEAIVHLAAVPAPSQAHGSEIMRINTTGTYNIYEAAANAGIRRLATASSINYLGYYYGTQEFPIQYLPLDEAHPNSTSDAYSLSKHITEQIAAYYWRRAGITSICLRLPAVIPQLDERMKRLRDGSLFASQFINGLLELPEEQRPQAVQSLLDHWLEMRRQRLLEHPFSEWGKFGFDFHNPQTRLAMGRGNFWTAIHVEDSAQAFEKSLFADVQGAHGLYVNDTHNWLGIESELLARVFYPQVSQRKKPLAGSVSLVSSELAQQLIGFSPQYRMEQLL